MLSKRTNILFEDIQWDKLVLVAKQEKTSVGDLIRKAVAETYITPHDRQTQRRASAIEGIRKIRSQISHQFTHEEIRELIHDGHKY